MQFDLHVSYISSENRSLTTSASARDGDLLSIQDPKRVFPERISRVEAMTLVTCVICLFNLHDSINQLIGIYKRDVEIIEPSVVRKHDVKLKSRSVSFLIDG